MRLYSYVVDRDYGFAPNPFGGGLYALHVQAGDP
ncbi:MAG: hypothetical protein H6675_00630 [Dehalococcoidia bacterium]|nr:hypothetical protein [Dehalococcoidia bacterium]